MRHWNIQVLYESVLQSPIESAPIHIKPVYSSVQQFIGNTVGVAVSCLVGMGLNISLSTDHRYIYLDPLFSNPGSTLEVTQGGRTQKLSKSLLFCKCTWLCLNV